MLLIENLGKEIVSKLMSDTSRYCIAVPLKPKHTTKLEPSWGSRYRKHMKITAEEFLVSCNCDRGKGITQKRKSPTCEFCGSTAGYRNRHYGITISSILFTKEDAKELNKIFKEFGEDEYISSSDIWLSSDNSQHSIGSSVSGSVRVLQTYYVKEKFGTNGVEIVRLTINATTDGTNIVLEEKYDKWCDVVPGQVIAAYKVTKAKGKEEIDLFDAFHITSDNVINDENIYFEGASSMIDFIYNYREFARRTGLDELVKNYMPTSNIPENSLFLLYLYLYSKYPVIELLVKMKFYGLIFGLMNKICGCYRRDSIKTEVENLSSLLNQTTKGNASLSIPSYVGQYLNAKNATIAEYFAWVSLNEYESISKENFEKIVDSEAYWYCNYYNLLGSIPNIIKYGYTLNQVFKYLMKQYMSRDCITIANNKADYRLKHPMVDIFNYWKDYLETCELMQVEPDKFPQDIKKAHDDIQKAYQAVKNQVDDKKLAAIADKYKSYKTTSKHYDIVLPRSVHDFVTEGNNQHNCVGGYAQRVIKGDCRIFFIRRIDDMSRSYITAECRKDGLGQLYYRNNTPVNDYNEREYAKAFCKFILSKGWD